ncbi:RNA polymerase sigma factor [Rudaea cellulosilytica]|jgi:RNA polymerase sigma-70 factor (ECF subfamily)|uniref:RNA polymerase sigma factor n=1 Tax=Rudaea cellulosilytica TaxID=540746 RepID=UPI001FE13006|nr:RNA polymerase sigma factor [Rudaea cellulosilytica]
MAEIAGTMTGSQLEFARRVDATSTNQRALDQFLRGVERRALRMAELACGSRDDALDVVQDAMCAFVKNYAAKPEPDWAPLFHRVLDSRLNDFHRRRTVRNRWLAVFERKEDDDTLDPIEQAQDLQDPGPLLRLAGSEAGKALDAALKALPLRQRQAFLLRMWEGFDVATTARVMQCSEGSVKTHLSRALAALRRALEDHQ